MTTNELIEQTIYYLKDQRSFVADSLSERWLGVLQDLQQPKEEAKEVKENGKK